MRHLQELQAPPLQHVLVLASREKLVGLEVQCLLLLLLLLFLHKSDLSDAPRRRAVSVQQTHGRQLCTRPILSSSAFGSLADGRTKREWWEVDRVSRVQNPSLCVHWMDCDASKQAYEGWSAWGLVGVPRVKLSILYTRNRTRDSQHIPARGRRRPTIEFKDAAKDAARSCWSSAHRLVIAGRSINQSTHRGWERNKKQGRTAAKPASQAINTQAHDAALDQKPLSFVFPWQLFFCLPRFWTDTSILVPFSDPPTRSSLRFPRRVEQLASGAVEEEEEEEEVDIGAASITMTTTRCLACSRTSIQTQGKNKK